MHFQCVALFLITLIETWSLFSIFTTITLKKRFQAPWGCSKMVFCADVCKMIINIKVQHTIQLWRRCAHVELFESD